MKTIAENLAALERELGVAAPEELPVLIGKLAELQAKASARLTAEAANGRRPDTRDELLDAKEAARRLGLSADYLYRHAKRLPFSVRIGRRLRFSAIGLSRYIRLRQQGR